MINYFSHKEIDFKKWDDCINKSTSLIYPLSWYLNCVSPNWDAFIVEKNGIYQAVFPICSKKKAGISYIYQPFFTQQLGYFSINPNQQEFEDFLKLIHKKFKHIISNLAIENTSFSIAIDKKLKKENNNCLLAIDSEYSIIKKNYNSNRKRDLKKAIKHDLVCNESIDINLLITSFKEFKGDSIDELKLSHYKTIYTIFKEGKKREQAKIFIVKNKEKEIQAVGLFIYTTTRITFLFGCATSSGRTNGAMTYLMDYVIQEFATEKFIFDFEGSNIPSILEYYKSFGAKSFTYLTITDKSIFFLLQKFKKLKKQLIFKR